jgi:hypothetical protein
MKIKFKKGKIVLAGILLLIFIFIFVVAIKNRQLVGLIILPTQKYIPTEIPSDTTDLFEYDGYIKNDIVYIYVQGGPNWELFEKKLSPFAWMPQSGTYIRVFSYQSQILNHTILAANPPLTDEQAQHEVTISAEMLYKTVFYFKNRNKKVYVFCISHGSQIGLEMLRNYPSIFDGLALTMVRLDLDKKALDLIRNGKGPYFNSNNEVTSRYLLPWFLRFPRLNNRIENMTMLMKVCRNTYTEALKDKDLSNVVYVYGKYDNKVGYPKPHELEFLKNKGVRVLELGIGHDDLGNVEYLDKINQLLMN